MFYDAVGYDASEASQPLNVFDHLTDSCFSQFLLISSELVENSFNIKGGGGREGTQQKVSYVEIV